MVLSFTKLLDWLMGKKEMRVIMAGLDFAGKTTILFKLKLGEVVNDIPTVGFNVETVEYNNIRFTVFDVSGLRTLWKYCFFDSQALAYVVDSSDHGRMADARKELHSMLKEEALKDDAALLVFANKQDKPDAMSVADLIDALDLHSLHKPRWHIQSACATSGEGLYEGLEWLVNIFAQI